ncbi:hypothetical protein V2O64_12855 [Verrucomicrobiaceae bacterium 227]
MSENPYAPPAVENLLAEDTAEEAIRRAHIKHETSIKSIGLLNYLGVFFVVLGLFSSSGPGPANGPEEIGYLLGSLLVPVILLLAGYSIRRLGRTGQILNIIIYGLTLIIFPVGTIIGLFALYILLSKKGRTIFSAPYKEIIKNTPHIRYQKAKTSKTAWVVLVIFLLFIILGIFGLATR